MLQLWKGRYPGNWKPRNTYSSEGKDILVVGSQGVPIFWREMYPGRSVTVLFRWGTVTSAKCCNLCSGKDFPNASVTTLLQQERGSPDNVVTGVFLWKCSSSALLQGQSHYNSALVHESFASLLHSGKIKSLQQISLKKFILRKNGSLCRVEKGALQTEQGLT